MGKLALPLIGVLVCLSGCGSDNDGAAAAATGACASSPALGTFAGSVAGSTDILNVKSDCTITSTYCVASMTYSNATATSGTVEITVVSTSGKTGCLPLGKTNCGYSINNSVLQFSCTQGTLTYTKQ